MVSAVHDAAALWPVKDALRRFAVAFGHP